MLANLIKNASQSVFKVHPKLSPSSTNSFFKTPVRTLFDSSSGSKSRPILRKQSTPSSYSGKTNSMTREVEATVARETKAESNHSLRRSIYEEMESETPYQSARSVLGRSRSNPSRGGGSSSNHRYQEMAEEIGTEGQPLYVVNIPKEGKHHQLFEAVKTIASIGLAGFIVYMILGSRGEGMDVFTKKGFNVHDPYQDRGPRVTFRDVKGCDEVVEEVREIVDYLRFPQKYAALGGKLPKGVLLTGPPGTGKTLLAKAIAGEANCPFYYISGSDFEEMFVGVGARRVRDLFKSARSSDSPAIIFIDEIDAVASKRENPSHQNVRQTLNQLLVEMDGFDDKSNVQSRNPIIVIGATNTPDMLDKALLRPGRFDKTVNVSLPDKNGRFDILKLYTRTKQLSQEVNLEVLARGTYGFSGADLFNLVNQAAIMAAGENMPFITTEHLEAVKDKIIMGAERKNAVIPQESLNRTAHHEAGHAIIAFFSPHALPIHKATIIPRGQALGLVAQLPKDDLFSRTKNEYLCMMDVCMGGRVAEELIYGEDNASSGASSDFEQATRIATAMVAKFGWGESTGIRSYDETKLTKEANQEVDRLLKESYDRAKALLTRKKNNLKLLASELLEHETLTGDEVRYVLMKNQKLKKKNQNRKIRTNLDQPADANDASGSQRRQRHQEEEGDQTPPAQAPRGGGRRRRKLVKSTDQ